MKTLITKSIKFIRFLYQAIYLAMQQFWAHRMRSVLTMLGILMGVASVTELTTEIGLRKAVGARQYTV